MRVKRIVVCGLVLTGLLFFHSQGENIASFSPEIIQEQFIDDPTIQKEIIWLDIRDDHEVEEGIIASEYCRPYHLSWNFDWDERYQDLPKDLPIIIYCRTGRRAGEAAAYLIKNGYDPNMVAVMSGGISAYKGMKTTDSLLIKLWSELPDPSFPLVTSKISRKTRETTILRARRAESVNNKRQIFNLKGQIINKSILNPSAPVFILERIGDTPHKRIRGIHQLIQKAE